MSEKSAPLEGPDRDEPGRPSAPVSGASPFLLRGTGLFILPLIVPDLSRPAQEKKKAE